MTGAAPTVRDGEDGGRWPRRGTMLAVAAGVVGVVGLGTGVWAVVSDQLRGGSTTATSAESGAAPALAAALAPVLSTDKNYTRGKLAADAKALVAKAEKGGDAVRTALAPEQNRESSDSVAGVTPAPASAPAPADGGGASKLLQPGVLAACLAALNATDQRPLAVDIARYDGREAALIVLQGEGGSLEVWAVSRDCGSGDEVPLTFLSVPK